MKTRIVMGSLILIVIGMMSLQVVAQRSENDDMYFTSKDREKFKAENATSSANDKIDSDYKEFKKKHFDENEEEVVENVNPTDSYSARNVNPEYISRSSSEQASEDEQNYYVEGYAPNTYDSYSSSNYNNYNNNWNNNNLNYGNNYGYGSAYNNYNSLYSPYYGSCNPWMSPYYGGSGWNLSMSYTWGNMGYGNSYYNPYSYYPSYYAPYYSNYYGNPYYYSGGSESSSVNYGKRPSRHSAIVTPTPRSRERVSSNANGSTSGRSRQSVDEYYVKPFRRVTTTTDAYSIDRYARPGATDNSRTRDSYNSNSRESKPTYSAPSRSSSGGSTPSRSSGSSSTPRSRGRD